MKYRLYLFCEQSFKTDAAPGAHTFDGIPKRPFPGKPLHKRSQRINAVGELDDGMYTKHSAFLVHILAVRPGLLRVKQDALFFSPADEVIVNTIREVRGLNNYYVPLTPNFFCSVLILGMIFHILQAHRIRSCCSLFLSLSCDSLNR